MINEFEVQRLKDIDNRLGLSQTLFIFAELFAFSGRFHLAENAQETLDESIHPWQLKSIREDQVDIDRVEMLAPINNEKMRFTYRFTHMDLDFMLELSGSTKLKVKQDTNAVLSAECIGADNEVHLLGFDARGKWYETLLDNIQKFYEEFAVLKYHYNKKCEKVG